METPSSLPANCHIRQAKATDIWTIRWLVLGAKLDPTQLRWQQFWLVEHHNGQILACGQLRTFGDCQELGSLVVRSPQRRQGLGTALTRHLLQQTTAPLYLECLGSQLAEFYQQLGFRPVVVEVLPLGLRRKFGLSAAVARLLRLPLYQMHWPQKQRHG
ncbi:MAG: GNAT family N-acetyltransferase [Cyanobacteria bacterium P01_E01_bin.43]